MLYALCYSLSNGWNHLEIAIKLNFWYSDVKFRRVIETDVKEFKIGVESELRKEDHFREVIERLKENLIKKGTKKYFITIA